MKYFAVCTVIVFAFSTSAFGDTWRGLVIAEENRCAPYDKKEQYPYPQSVEDKIIATMDGKIYGPYTGRYFDSKRKTDIVSDLINSFATFDGLEEEEKQRLRLAVNNEI